MTNWPALLPADEAYPLQAAEELQRRRKARKSFYEFVRQGWAEVEAAPFVDNWHIGAMCEHLQAVTAGQIMKLLINVPPGMGKSLLTSVFWPAWEWAQDPTVRWFFASYDQRLSTRDSVRCRALLQRPWYGACCGHTFRLLGDQNQKSYYETDQGGYRLATSVGGHGSGEHPDRIVCDDPHNVQQAESPVERQAVLEWWDRTMSTRGVSRNARRVIIMQRLHQEDLSGHVLEEGDWVHLCLPMRYEPGRMAVTPLAWTDPRTQENQLLAPELFPDPVVAKIEKSLGAYGTAGQLQQRPTPKEGGMFKEHWFKQRVQAAPYQAARVRYWDRAATPQGGCRTVGTLLCKSTEGNLYVEHVIAGQWGPDERDEIILATALRDQRRYGPKYPPRIYIEQEPGSAGIDSYRHIARKLQGFPVCADRVTGAKEVRAEPWASQCAAGTVFLVEDGTWEIREWIAEHCAFPLGKFTDRIDSASGAFGKLANRWPTAALRVVDIRGERSRSVHIVVLSHEELASEVMDEYTSLLIAITDPEPVGKPELPKHRIGKLVGSVVLSFLDSSAEEHQSTWTALVPGYGKPASELLMSRETGKKLWGCLLRKRDTPIEIIAVADGGGADRRALSVALAICDILHLSRPRTIFRVCDPDWKAPPDCKAPNEYVYAMTKRTRETIVGGSFL
jgi:predicted phage terminase large subunit-like protein